MASAILFPPIVSASQPAFLVGNNSEDELKIYFSLSALSSTSSDQIKNAHVSITRKDGVKVLNTKDENGRYRSTGIILDVPIETDYSKDNYYYVTIKNYDLSSDALSYKGFIPGQVYKVQIRLSEVSFADSDSPQQANQITLNSNYFSEQSTVCYVKAISDMKISIPLFGYSSLLKQEEDTISTLNAIDFNGSISSLVPESNEYFESCNVKLYKENKLIENSGDIFRTELSDAYFSYTFKTNFVLGENYDLQFTYITENGYTPKEPLVFHFNVNADAIGTINARIITVDTNYNNLFDGISTVDSEENEGRIGLKLFSNSNNPYSGNICIRRSSQEDNFNTQTDVKIFTLKGENINSYPVIQDYGIQSGIWYKYGVQSISKQGERGTIVETTSPIQRIFNYSYLLGENDQQLKLQFDNTMTSFKVQVLESKTETIGSQFPYVTRNANVYYKTFPINGLISFQMDENNTFLQNGRKDVYNYSSIVDKYSDYNDKHNIKQYDYTYERDFRKLVLDFLSDGKPKLFKSPTEGNIIVRLMDVNCTPNQSLDRMIYSFTSTANEIDEPTLSNYVKYGFMNPGFYSTDFVSSVACLGQLRGPFTLTNGRTDNLLKLIYEKYDSQDKNIGGNTNKVKTIEEIRITVEDQPSRILVGEVNGTPQYQLGQQFMLDNNNTYTIYDPRGIYEFDSLMKFRYENKVGDNSLVLLAGDGITSNSINAVIDFVYTLETSLYEPYEIQTRKPIRGIGQFFQEVQPGTNIWRQIYSKYYINSPTRFRYLSSIAGIEIEANPHTVFLIKDAVDAAGEYHEVNDTGILNLMDISEIYSIEYVGKRYIKDKYDDSTVSNNIITTDVEKYDFQNRPYKIKAAADVSILYTYIVMEGTYKSKIGG